MVGLVVWLHSQSLSLSLSLSLARARAHTHTHTHTHTQRCNLTDYFNNYNFSKAQIICSLMKVIKPKHVGTLLM